MLGTEISPKTQSRIWDPEHECQSKESREALQLNRLRTSIDRAYRQVPHYRENFDRAGVAPDSIKSLDDLRQFPFLLKDDLREHFPYELFASPLNKVIRLHASSGTTGRPTVVGYTKADIDLWAENVARIVTAVGATADDLAQISFGYGLFTGAFGLHYGLERIGATVLPVSGGNTRRQVEIMLMFKPTILVCTPSYALHIAEVAAEMGVGPDELPMRLGLFGAEPWSDSMRHEIEMKLGLIATDNYGLSEVIGPGVAGECLEKSGMHVNEDHFFVEVIDSNTLERLPDGELGELVFTSLTKEALPVIRYRTRDLARIERGVCACGRTNVRMSRVVGRTDDMLIIRGVNVFPSQIESVLLEVEGAQPHYQITIERAGTMDEVTVEVEVSEGGFSDEAKRLYGLREKIERRLATALGITMRVRLAEPHSIERSVGKAKRVIDKRKL